jgi:hypothetical protein
MAEEDAVVGQGAVSPRVSLHGVRACVCCQSPHRLPALMTSGQSHIDMALVTRAAYGVSL